MHKVKG